MINSPMELKEMVDRYIREEIFERRTLGCGDQINERELSRILGVSRAPVREALKGLEEQGLVAAVKYRGWFVEDFLEEDLREINRLRTLLEHNLFETLAALGSPSDEELAKVSSFNHKLEEVLTMDIPFERRVFEFAEREMDFHFCLYSLAGDNCVWTTKMLRNLSYQIRCGFHRWFCDERQMAYAVESHGMLIEYLRKRNLSGLRELLYTRLARGPLATLGKKPDENSAVREQRDPPEYKELLHNNEEVVVS